MSKVIHNKEVEMLCDKITILKEGRVVVSCKVNELLSFVGGYIITIMMKRNSHKRMSQNKKYSSIKKNFLSFNDTQDKKRRKTSQMETEESNSKQYLLEQERALENFFNQLDDIKKRKPKSKIGNDIIPEKGKYALEVQDIISYLQRM